MTKSAPSSVRSGTRTSIRRQVLSASTVIQSVPPGRVLTLAVALGTGGIEHLLNPRPEPGSGSGILCHSGEAPGEGHSLFAIHYSRQAERRFTLSLY
jgi:hypothetical protein